MAPFIELTLSEDEETNIVLVNTSSIGRIFPHPQNKMKSMVELNYHSINDAPVCLEVNITYERLRLSFLA